jgi:multisubunit Na+/H+ antiporter MnhB subunit
MAPVRYRALISAMCVLTGLGLGVAAGLLFAFAGLTATPSADAAVESYSSGTVERNIVNAFTVCTVAGLAAGIALAVVVDRYRRRRSVVGRS